MPTNPLPRARAVVLNYDGGDMTMRCLGEPPSARLPALIASSWSWSTTRRSTGSSTGSRPSAPTSGSSSRSSTAASAAAATSASAIPAAGEYDHVALINNDAMAEPGWLRPLVDALEADPGLGAAASKMLFAERAWSVALDVELVVQQPHLAVLPRRRPQPA